MEEGTLVVTTLVHARVQTDTLAGDSRAQDRTWCATNAVIPWLEQYVTFKGARVLEYGCGSGAVSQAFAARAARVDGLDINAAEVARGTDWQQATGVENVHLASHPPEEILDAMRDFAGRVDIVLLYAVLEHLSLDERLEVLAIARELVPNDGFIICIETPNRLVSFDHHSTQMPYLHWLELELGVRYGNRSPRPDFTRELAHARREHTEREWWTRYGRTVSFHEFELAFGDIDAHVAAGGYDSVMWPARPLHPSEPPLALDLSRHRPDLGPAWSRAWLDLVLTPRPQAERPPAMRPWQMRTQGSTAVAWTIWDSVELFGERSRLRIELEHPTRRLIVAFAAAPGDATLLVETPDGETASVPTSVSGEGRVRYVDLEWERPSDAFEVGLSVSGYVVLVCYEG